MFKLRTCNSGMLIFTNVLRIGMFFLSELSSMYFKSILENTFLYYCALTNGRLSECGGCDPPTFVLFFEKSPSKK